MGSGFGTFADSKNAPIHRWFQYPAGFSYKAVETVLRYYHINKGMSVYDPFVGTGTTCVTCKFKGIESCGVEAHPFVAKIARTKLRWDYDYEGLRNTIDDFSSQIQKRGKSYREIDIESVPELLRKCYTPINLKNLLFLRNQIQESVPDEYKDFFEIALIGTLRIASGAAAGWPYIAPKKKKNEKDGVRTFLKQINLCYHDLRTTPKEYRKIRAEIIEGDSRKTDIPDESYDIAFTSPPYLNNFDYADRTRLEMYFTDCAKTWSDITEKVRDKLIISATTQIVRSKYDEPDIVSDTLKRLDPAIAMDIQLKVNRLSEARKTKGGKKSYDIMVGQYFNDMAKSMMDTYRILKKNSMYLLILGDSAPYGVHIQTESILGEIGKAVGFKNSRIMELRRRGDKWKGNPQRHHVKLRESVLILEK